MSAAFVVMAAFLAGLVSVSSPCCLPLLPGYVAYLGGAGPASPRPTMAAAGLFVLGFGATFTALGASASWLGAALLANQPVLLRAAGLLVAAMGAATMLGTGIPGLAGERRLVALHGLPRGPGFAAPLGRRSRWAGRPASGRCWPGCWPPPPPAAPPRPAPDCWRSTPPHPGPRGAARRPRRAAAGAQRQRARRPAPADRPAVGRR